MRRDSVVICAVLITLLWPAPCANGHHAGAHGVRPLTDIGCLPPLPVADFLRHPAPSYGTSPPPPIAKELQPLFWHLYSTYQASGVGDLITFSDWLSANGMTDPHAVAIMTWWCRACVQRWPAG